MKAWTIAGAGLVLMSGVGIAMAQAPTAPQMAAPPPGAPPGMSPAAAMPGPAGGPPMEAGPGRGPMGGHMGGPMEARWGWRHHRMGGMMEHMPPPPSKAAHFRLRKGDAMMDIKCADDEPMKACVDAASALLDKAAAQK